MRARSFAVQALGLLALVATACSGNAGTYLSPGATTSPATTQSAPTSAAAGSQAHTPWPTPKVAPTMPDLPSDQMAALNSLARVDDYPLYTMEYRRSYDAAAPGRLTPALGRVRATIDWCSLFAALADPANRLYGRNFDYDYEPGLLLRYTPVDGYPSVSMVPLGFLDYNDRLSGVLDKAPLAERQQLLNAPSYAFDGMNAKGLVVALAAVPTEAVPNDPEKPTIFSLFVIREILDHAATVDEAVKIVQSYNVYTGPGLAIHWLVAERSGKAAILEFSDGKLAVIPNGDRPWHMATNFLVSEAGDDPEDSCWRYRILSEKLAATRGALSANEAMGLLSDVHQGGTQWSVVYHMSTGDVDVAMGLAYSNVHTFHLDLQP
jgi:hypothetical protein